LEGAQVSDNVLPSNEGQLNFCVEWGELQSLGRKAHSDVEQMNPDKQDKLQ
jgi:hypothetical protein